MKDNKAVPDRYYTIKLFDCKPSPKHLVAKKH